MLYYFISTLDCNYEDLSQLVLCMKSVPAANITRAANTYSVSHSIQGVLQQIVLFIWAGTQRVCMSHKKFLHNYDAKT